jgi:3-methyl-2-oxobutanoate hydroxymethyltransferase
VLVCYDLLGMYPDLKPKFAKRFAEIGEQIVAATRAYVDEVQERAFPAPEHTFKRRDGGAPVTTGSTAGAPVTTGSPVGAPSARAKPVVPVLTDDEIPPHWQTH